MLKVNGCLCWSVKAFDAEARASSHVNELPLFCFRAQVSRPLGRGLLQWCVTPLGSLFSTKCPPGDVTLFSKASHEGFNGLTANKRNWEHVTQQGALWKLQAAIISTQSLPVCFTQNQVSVTGLNSSWQAYWCALLWGFDLIELLNYFSLVIFYFLCAYMSLLFYKNTKVDMFHKRWMLIDFYAI